MKNLIYVATCLVALAGKSYAQSPLSRRLDSLTLEYQKANFHGIVLIGNKNEIIYSNAFGYADLGENIPMTVDKLFKTESVGKMFTSIRVMQLMEQGKIDLNKTVAYYLSDWKIRNADKITIHQLLNHTSGLTSTWDDPKYANVKFMPDDQLKKLIESQPLAFDMPGSRFYYSNSGYIVLGEIISRIDKQPFDASIRTNIFQPAGMEKIGHLNDTVMPENGAKPYFFLSSKDYVQNNQGLGPKAGPAGGWITNGTELMKFLQFYMKNALIKSNTKDIQLTANHTIDVEKRGWHSGYGIRAITDELVSGKTLVGHNGGGAGFSIDAFIEPESGYAIVMCSNMFGTGYNISRNYFDILLNRPVRKIRQSNLIRVVDLVQQKGGAYMHEQRQAFFNELDIKPDARLLINASENLEQLGDLTSARQVLALGQELFSDIAHIWLSSGHLAVRSKELQQAKTFYEKARKLAGEEKNDFILQIAKDKLKDIEDQ